MLINNLRKSQCPVLLHEMVHIVEDKLLFHKELADFCVILPPKSIFLMIKSSNKLYSSDGSICDGVVIFKV